MAILHLVNKSPWERNALSSCLRLAKPGSALLLIEDGVYAAQRAGDMAARIEAALGEHKVFALQADIDARGLNDRLNPSVTLVDYDGFVQLATEYDKVQSWL